MIKLMPPPRPARRVLHLNSPSSSPGGKDYVLVQLDNGELWAVNGTALQVRNGGGAVQHPKKSWLEMVNEKTRKKSYSEVGEYSQGSWWSSGGSVYADVPNIPIAKAAPPPPALEPEPPPVAPQPSKTTSLAEQYPVSDMAKTWSTDSPGEWFAVF